MPDQSPDDPIFGDKPDDELSGLGRPSQPEPTPEPAAATPPPPPPPPAGAQPMGTPPAGASSALVSDAFSWAVARFQQHAAILIALAAVVFALRAGQTIIGNAVVSATGGSTAGSAAGFAVVAVLGIAFGIAAWLASIGVYRAALRRTQGVEPSFAQLTTGENLGSYIVVAIVLGITVSIGLLLCLLPGLIAIFLFMFAPFLALDQGMGVGEAFRTSYRMVMENIGTVLVAALINIVATLLGGILWGLLGLVMLPFSALFTAYVYRSLRGEPVAP